MKNVDISALTAEAYAKECAVLSKTELKWLLARVVPATDLGQSLQAILETALDEVETLLCEAEDTQ